MIITLKGANFSASNIGQLNSWFVTYNLTGAEKQSGPISIDKDNNTGMTATIKVYDNYDFQSASAVYNGKTVNYVANSGIITINITEKITTAVTITVLATVSSDEPDTPVTPDTPSGETIWYINSLEQMQETQADIVKDGVECYPQASSAWGYQESFNKELINQRINTIEIFSYKAGHFTFGAYDKVKLEYTQRRTVEIPEAQITQKYTFDEFTLGQDEIFVWDIPEGDQLERGSLWYLLKAKAPAGVDTSGWYWIDRDGNKGVTAFSDFELALSINIGYTNN